MVVTGTRRAQPRRAGAFPQRSNGPRRCEAHKLLEQLADLGAGEPVVAVPAMGLDRQEAGVGQLAEVTAGRRPADARFVGEHAGGQRPPVVEGEQHLAPGRIGQQRGQRGDVGVAARRKCGGVTHDRPPLCIGAGVSDRAHRSATAAPINWTSPPSMVAIRAPSAPPIGRHGTTQHRDTDSDTHQAGQVHHARTPDRRAAPAPPTSRARRQGRC